jgi:endoglucanase
MIADKGFDHIRLVIQWDTHFFGDSSKCNIDPEYMKQVRWAVDNTIAAGMIAVVDDHNLIFEMKSGVDFKGNGYTYAQVAPCEKAIYRQIIEEMKDISPDSFVVELPNEPTVDPYISAEQWNNLADSLIQIVHGVDPARVIIVGSRNYYSRDYLSELRLDNSDGLLIASFHYYEPYSFTMNCGASTALKFVDGVNVWDDTCGTEVWNGTRSQLMTIYNDFEVAAQWSKAHGDIPVYLGEFGVRQYVKDTTSSEKWLGAVAQIADHFGFATAVFSFDSDTHLYHILKDKWDAYKLRALFNSKDKFVVADRPDLDTVSKTVLLEDFEEDFPVSKLSSELGNDEKWDFYSNCKEKTDCKVVVASNESGTNIESTTLASFTTKKGHTGDGLYMKLAADAPKGVDPYYMLQVNFVPYTGSSPTYIDFSGMKAISFYAKGQGKIRAVLLTAYSDSIATANESDWNAGFYGEFVLKNEWTQYVIWPDALVPEKYSVLEKKEGEWDKAMDRVYKIVLKQGNDVVSEEKSTVEWYLDDFTIYGLDLLDFQ